MNGTCARRGCGLGYEASLFGYDLTGSIRCQVARRGYVSFFLDFVAYREDMLWEEASSHTWPAQLRCSVETNYPDAIVHLHGVQLLCYATREWSEVGHTPSLGVSASVPLAASPFWLVGDASPRLEVLNIPQ